MRTTFRRCLPLLAAVPLAGAAVVDVDTVAALDQAVAAAKRGDEIVLEPGTYRLEHPIVLREAGVTLRGATGKPADVVLKGTGMNERNLHLQDAIDVSASDITIAALTVRDFYFNGIHIRAENDVDRVAIRDVDTWNIGEVHIKGSRDPGKATTTDDDVIERVHIRQTEARAYRAETDANSDYIGGIDLMSAVGVAIRDCVIEGIHGSKDEGKPAIFLWNGIERPTIERNRIVGCARGIGIGNPATPAANLATGNYHAVGGIVRNNTIVRGPWGGGNTIAIELCSVKGLQVAHNTVYSEDAAYFRTVSLYNSDGGGGEIADLVFANNLIRGGIKDFTDGKGWREEGDIDDALGGTIVAGWFVDAAKGDLHLTEAAKPAIGGGKPLADVRDDMDGEPRGKVTVDLGADERSAGHADAGVDAAAKATP